MLVNYLAETTHIWHWAILTLSSIGIHGIERVQNIPTGGIIKYKRLICKKSTLAFLCFMGFLLVLVENQSNYS